MREDIFNLGIKALIRDKKGRILLLKNNPKNASGFNPPHWDLPGGRLRKGDDIETTLRREAEEEIGISQIKIIKFIDASISKLRIRSGKKTVGLILFTYLCSIKDTRQVRVVDDEHIQFKWCTPFEAAKLLKVKFSDSLALKITRL